MGFSYTRGLSGRMRLACDFCGKYPARKIRCPFGWCQAWATCADCKKAGKHKQSSCGGTGNDNHETCKARTNEALVNATTFRAGGLNLPLRFCKKYGYIIDTEADPSMYAIYSASCDVTHQTWHDTPDTLATAYGHTWHLSRVTDN